MKYNDDAELDTSEVSDTRGSRGSGGSGGLSGGNLGGGLIGVLLSTLLSGRRGKGGIAVVVLLVVGYLVFAHFSGSGGAGRTVLGNLGQGGRPATADNTDLQKDCRTGEDANEKLECAIVADIDSVQAFWTAELPKVYNTDYSKVDTVFFSGSVTTACGSADSSAGPFYCPGDKLVYIDLSFYNDLKTQFGAEGGPLVNAYVLAHEYGHHVQDLLGIEAKVRTRQGASSDSVRLELQADCFAGVWMHSATTVPAANGQPFIQDITQADLDSAIDTAQRIGDDYIQTHLGGGTVNPDSFTHGTSAQRKQWLSTGFRSGDPKQCNTFSARDLG